MRILKLESNDSEIFNYELSVDETSFFCSHKNEFRKMWKEQGKTFWLRFLFTFQLSAESYIIEGLEFDCFLQKYGDKLSHFILIYIHKNFIEARDIEHVEEFIQSILDKLVELKKKEHKDGYVFHDVKRSLYDMKCFQDFIANKSSSSGACKRLPSSAIGVISRVCLGFANGMCFLLRRWLKESDVDSATAGTIDYTLYYWRPTLLWHCDDDFEPSCFEKYVSTYWGKSLPKMLLTCNIDEIFSNHKVNNCCEAYTSKLDSYSVQSLNKIVFEVVSLRVVKVISPNIEMCNEHNNCNLRIRHTDACPEPFICRGSKSCVLTCQTACRETGPRAETFWKNSAVDVKMGKEKNTRDVAVQAESLAYSLETFCPADKTGKHVSLSSLDLEEMLFSFQDSTVRNSYIQHKRKEEYRLKLRKKLSGKHEVDYSNAAQLKCIFDKANHAFLRETASPDDLKYMIYTSSQAIENVFQQKLDAAVANVKYRELCSVAIGTSGIVFGIAVLPSKSLCSNGLSMETDNKLDTKTIAHVSINVNIQSEGKRGKKITVTSKGTRQANEIAPDSGNDTQVNSSCTVAKKSKKKKGKKTTDSAKSNENPATQQGNKVENGIQGDKNDNLVTKSIKNVNISPSKIDLGLVKEKIVNGIQDKNNILVAQGIKNLQISSNKSGADLLKENIVNGFQEGKNNVLVTQGIKNLTFTSNKIDVDLVKERAEKAIDYLYNLNDSSSTANLNSEEKEDSGNKTDVDEELETFYKFVNSDNKLDQQSKQTDEIPESAAKQCAPDNIDQSTSSSATQKKSKFKTCANCQKQEIEYRTFKRCSRCKAENSPIQYYYCSRQCQLEDWEKSHREKHPKRK